MPSISPERRAALEAERARNDSGNNFYSTKNLTDDNIRLLPLAANEPVATKRVYYFLQNKSYICNEGTHQQPGVIARCRRALTALGTEEAAEIEKAIDKQRRAKWVMKIISRKDPNTVQWFEAPKAIYQVIFDAMFKDNEAIDAAKDGRDIRISKNGTGVTAKYTAAVSMQTSPLAPTKDERIALRAEAAKMDLATILRADEKGAFDVLRGMVAAHIWRQIEKDVRGNDPQLAPSARAVAATNDEDANPDAGDDDEPEELRPDPATVTRQPARQPARPVADAGDDDEGPAAPAAARAAPAAAARPVDEEDEDVPVRSANGKSGPAAAPARQPARTAPAPAADEEDEPAPAPAKAPTTAPRGRAAAVVDDEEDEVQPAPRGRQHQVDDDE